MKSDLFGLENVYYSKNQTDYSDNLLDKIYENGFTDYSKEGISSYFTFRYPVLENTMFDDFKRFDACIELKNEKAEHYFYPTFDEQNITEKDAINKIEKLLINAIEKLIKGKKRIGVMLSGGLDSSLVLAILKKHFKGIELYTYSCGFYGEDEFEYSDLVAKLFSDKHQKFILGKDDFIGENSILASLIKEKCAPLHPNELPLAYAERQAKLDCCDMILCGEGADDLFGGYGKNLRMYLNFDNNKQTYVEYLLDNYRYFTQEEVKKLIKDEYFVDDVELIKSVFEEPTCPKDVKNKMFYFIQRLHTKGLIERGNNACKYNGLEAGFPFIDMDLLKFINTIPFDLKVKYKDGFSDENCADGDYREVSEKCDFPKYILKKIGEKYLPLDVIYRKKYGFPVPFAQWLGDINELTLNKKVFKTNDISFLNGWKKYMVINLNTFINVFEKYRKGE